MLVINSAYGFTYRIYNQTRSRLAIKLNIIAAPDEDIVIEPESFQEVVIDGARKLSPLRSIEIEGMTDPVASLGRKVHEIESNRFSPVITFYIGHKNPTYVSSKVIIGSSKPRLAIYPGSGEIFVEER